MDLSEARVLVAEPQHLAPAARQLLVDACEEVTDADPALELSRAFAAHDAIWIRLGHEITADVIGQTPRCRVLAVPATGLDHIDLVACGHHGVEVVSLRGETAFLDSVRGTAEHTVGLLLALLRRIPAAATSVLDGQWERDAFRGREIHGKRVGIVGLGRLGSQVARLLVAFGADVEAFDPRPDGDPSIRRTASLDALLSHADIVTIHVSLDATTEGLIGSHEFSRMREGAVLINTSRGRVIDEAAMLSALDNGHLGGAAVDVVTGEPDIGAEHPLVAYAAAHDNLLITPHIGGNTTESGSKTDVFIAERLLDRLRRVER